MKSINQQTFQGYLVDLIGLDYKEYDCWGIVKLFYKKVFNINLKLFDFSNEFSTSETDKIIKKEKNNFTKVDKPEFGEIIVLKILGKCSHVGVYIGNGKFLHTNKKTGSIIDDLRKHEKRIEGFYKWQE